MSRRRVKSRLQLSFRGWILDELNRRFPYQIHRPIRQYPSAFAPKRRNVTSSIRQPRASGVPDRNSSWRLPAGKQKNCCSTRRFLRSTRKHSRNSGRCWIGRCDRPTSCAAFSSPKHPGKNDRPDSWTPPVPFCDPRIRPEWESIPGSRTRTENFLATWQNQP